MVSLQIHQIITPANSLKYRYTMAGSIAMVRLNCIVIILFVKKWNWYVS